MAISRTQNVSANATSVAITSATAGDFIVCFAFNGTNNTGCSLPAGFSPIAATTTANSAARFYYKIAAGGETSSGVSTNATQIVCMVYRGASGFGTTPTITSNSNTTVTYAAVTLLNASGSSWVIGFAAGASMTAGMNGTPTGTAPNLVNQTSQIKCNGLDTNAGVTSFSAQTLAVTTTGRWQSTTIELWGATVFTQSYAPTFSPTAALTRQLSKSLTAALSFVGNLVRTYIPAGGTLFTQSFTATLSFIGAMSPKQILTRAFTATLSFIGSFSVSKSFLKAFSATLSFAGNLTRAVGHFFTKSLTATLSFIGTFASIFSGGFTILAGQVTGGSPSIVKAGSSVNIMKTGSQLTIQKTETIE